MSKLSNTYFQNDDVVFLAKDLLGKLLVTKIDDEITAGIITETEAYNGRTDKACHAYNNKRTPRTSVMYKSGGLAYVYLCYGIHNLFNIVTNSEGLADAVLIRAVEPLKGHKTMLKRRSLTKIEPRLSSGPGSMSKALGINRTHNGISLVGEDIWLEHYTSFEDKDIIQTTRIGIDYAEEDAFLPWRFYVKNNRFISKK